MAKNNIGDYDEVDADNTDVSGIPLEGNITLIAQLDDAFRAIMGALKRYFGTNLFRLRDSTDQTKQLAFDLSGIATATTRTIAVPDRDGTVALTDDNTSRRNRMVNGDMRVSQENGTTAGTANGRYPVDQWAQYFVTSAGTLTVAQVASVTPAGSPNRLRATVTTADASLAAGEFWTLTQNLEGSNVADFRYGSASAKASVLRFGFKGPAGTYAVALHNSAGNRSFVALFTIASGDANTDTVQEIAIPGDTTGTWLTADGVIGVTLDIVLACGSTFQGTTGWQSGNILGTSGVSNGMATQGAVFELFDVGLRLDPDSTGVYGQYEVGDVHPVYRSERYVYKPTVDGSESYFGSGQAVSTTIASVVVTFDQEMAVKPTLSTNNTFFLFSSGQSTLNVTSLSIASGTSVSKKSARLGVAVASGLTAGQGIVLWAGVTASALFLARLS